MEKERKKETKTKQEESPEKELDKMELGNL